MGKSRKLPGLAVDSVMYEALDDARERGAYASRSELYRVALREWLDRNCEGWQEGLLRTEL